MAKEQGGVPTCWPIHRFTSLLLLPPPEGAPLLFALLIGPLQPAGLQLCPLRRLKSARQTHPSEQTTQRVCEGAALSRVLPNLNRARAKSPPLLVIRGSERQIQTACFGGVSLRP
jgi:hypothetical protein